MGDEVNENITIPFSPFLLLFPSFPSFPPFPLLSPFLPKKKENEWKLHNKGGFYLLLGAPFENNHQLLSKNQRNCPLLSYRYKDIEK